MLRGSALAHERRFDAATNTFARAVACARGSTSPALEADLHVAMTPLHFGVGNMAMVKWAADCALRPPPSDPSNQDASYFVPLEHSRGRALNVHGVVAAKSEDYRTQLSYVRRAIAELRGAPSADLWLTASAMKQLAFHIRDFDLPSDAMQLRLWLGENDLPEELAPMRFEMHRALGWSSALQGDHLGAFREFRLMTTFATTAPYQILATVERAYLTRELGETHSAREQIEFAATLADRVDWNATGEERIALAQLAQEVAAFAPQRARTLFDRYRNISSKLPPAVLNASDRRAVAYERLAEGTVLRANGSTDAAQKALVAAFTIWDAIGFRWRAATAAIALVELTASPRFVTYLRDESARYPMSWLQRRARAVLN